MNRAKYYMKNKKETNYGMFLAYLTLFTALTISGVAIFYSVSGLAAIFSAAVIPIIIMGGVLEVSKLVTAVWLHKYWKEATWWLKGYLSIAVLVLMLITSIGIFGFLSKAHDTASGNATEAIATVTRIDGQIAREENRIEILEDRITGISSGTGFDVTSSITQQETIRDGAWDRVQDDIDYAQGQIDRLRDQLATLDSAVNELRNKGVEVITTEEGGLFQGDTTQTIDYVAQADTLYNQQKEQRDSIDEDIDDQQSNIDSYRLQAQNTINSANAEINRLRNQSTSSQDDDLNQIDEWNLQIDGIYNTIDGLKDEKFESEQAVRLVESEVGPIRYIAEFFTGTEDADASLLESAVSWLIMIIIFVFDPLAVLLLIASQYTFEQRRKERFPEGEPTLKKPEPFKESPINQELEEAVEHFARPELDFTSLQTRIELAKKAVNDWEESQKILEGKASAEQDQVIEPVSEPVEEQLEMDFDAEPEVIEEVVKPKPPIIATEIETDGVTVEEIAKSESEGDYMLDPEGRSIHKDALKSLHPELFLNIDSERASSTKFGTVFPPQAIKGDIFVRVDQMPNRVYKFEGNNWIEVQKEISDTYLYDEEYIKHLVSKIQTGEYDVDLLSDSERQQIEIYLTDNKG
tara:strand:+ start:142 stop:2046 length:1905 start_codon:yes stop_codon:yes gene_type:complete